MPVFDAHVHLGGEGLRYDLDLVGRNVIFNDVPSYSTYSARAQRSENEAVTLILALGDDAQIVRQAAHEGRIDALKIHSRAQRLDAQGWETARCALAGMPAALPVVVDAFYFGKDLQFQPSLPAIAGLLEQFPDRTFVIAHCGGYRVLEYFFHLREFSNCWYDLSFSLQYLADTSCRDDLKKLIRYTDKAKIVFGSDYPYASPSGQYETLKNIAAELELSAAEFAAICAGNALKLFKKDALAWTPTK